jgi:hypothetical protein
VRCITLISYGNTDGVVRNTGASVYYSITAIEGIMVWASGTDRELLGIQFNKISIKHQPYSPEKKHISAIAISEF